MKFLSGTVVLLIGTDPTGRPFVIEAISEDREVEFLDLALESGVSDPLGVIHERRELQCREDEAFADYIEGLISTPGCRLELRNHAVGWFQSRIHLEKYQRAEAEARQVIADFAFQLYCDDPNTSEFILASGQAEVRVRVIHLNESFSSDAPASAAAA